jgi:hypothetical protein
MSCRGNMGWRRTAGLTAPCRKEYAWYISVERDWCGLCRIFRS